MHVQLNFDLVGLDRGEARERRRLMAAISLNRCGLLPGGGGGGAGMEEAHPLNWRLVKSAALLYGNTPLEVGGCGWVVGWWVRRFCCRFTPLRFLM